MSGRALVLFFRISPSYYAFISGLLISPLVEMASNLGISNGVVISRQIILAGLGSLFFAIGSMFALILSTQLESLRRLSFEGAPDFVNPEVAWLQLVNARKRRLFVLLLGIVLCALLGMVFLTTAIVSNLGFETPQPANCATEPREINN